MQARKKHFDIGGGERNKSVSVFKKIVHRRFVIVHTFCRKSTFLKKCMHYGFWKLKARRLLEGHIRFQWVK